MRLKYYPLAHAVVAISHERNYSTFMAGKTLLNLKRVHGFVWPALVDQVLPKAQREKLVIENILDAYFYHSFSFY